LLLLKFFVWMLDDAGRNAIREKLFPVLLGHIFAVPARDLEAPLS
jgi:hypothetical protein